MHRTKWVQDIANFELIFSADLSNNEKLLDTAFKLLKQCTIGKRKARKSWKSFLCAKFYIDILWFWDEFNFYSFETSASLLHRERSGWKNRRGGGGGECNNQLTKTQWSQNKTLTTTNWRQSVFTHRCDVTLTICKHKVCFFYFIYFKMVYAGCIFSPRVLFYNCPCYLPTKQRISGHCHCHLLMQSDF